MLVLDTTDIAPQDRADAFREALGRASVPSRVEHLVPDEDIRARMHLWQFGGVNLFTADASGFRLVRTPTHVRMESPAIVAVAFQTRGRGEFTQFDRDQVVVGSVHDQ